MSMHEYLERLRRFDRVLDLAPHAGGPFPEIAWGDHFFYFAPDGQVPQREQPFATCVTKDYPDDRLSRLGTMDQHSTTQRWRLNIHVGRERFTELTGERPRPMQVDGDTGTAWDFAANDAILPHPVYRAQGWIAIVCPSLESLPRVVDLLAGAHSDAKRRWHRSG